MAMVYGYCRVSTDEQATSGLGVAAQRAALAGEAQRRAWDVQYVTDDGYSAKSLQRPGLREMLSGMRRGDVLMVAKLDRLSRSVVDFAGLMDRAHREGWDLVVLDLALDTSTPMGRFVALTLANVAELERGMIGQRTSAALQAKKAAGARLGAPVQLAESTRARIVAEHEAGHSLRTIAERLTGDGIPTARGGKWHASTVRAVLTSRRLDAEAAGAAAVS